MTSHPAYEADPAVLTGETIAESQTPAPDRKLPRFYTYAQTAAVFGKSPRTIRAWVKSGHIHAIKIGNARLIAETEIRRVSDGDGVMPAPNSSEFPLTTNPEEG